MKRPCELTFEYRTLLMAVCVAATLWSAETARAQETIYVEDFNSPGNGTRYRLIRDYYEVTQQNTLWTTVPNQLPGDNVVVYLEPGDQYIDGTPVPARRATFFADNDLGDQSFGIDLTDEGFNMFDAAVQWATGTDGTTPLTINFVIDDDSFDPLNNLDLTLVERLEGQGHTVNVTNPDLPPEDGDDLIFMASHDDGSAVGGMAPEFKTTTTPLISGFFHAASPLGFGSERGENTNGTYDLLIVDPTHPLAGGNPAGLVQVVDEVAARQRLTRVTRGTIAPDSKIVATLPGATIETPDDFTNFEGDGYLRGGHATWNNAPEAGQPRGWQTIESLDTSRITSPQLLIDIAAMGDLDQVGGPYENELDNPDDFDFIRVLADEDADGDFEVLTEFVAVDDFSSDFFGFLQADDGTILNTEFQTFTINLPSATSLDLRIDVFTNAADERIGIDHIRVIGQADSVLGDFDADGQLTANDVNLLSAEVRAGSHDGAFDLNSDGAVNATDHTIWVKDLKLTWFGDANLDGSFDSNDAVLVLAAGEYEDGVPLNSRWETGDWNGDGDFSSGDFVVALGDGGFEAGPRQATLAVPEPTSATVMLLGIIGFVRRRR